MVDYVYNFSAQNLIQSYLDASYETDVADIHTVNPFYQNLTFKRTTERKLNTLSKKLFVGVVF